MKRPVMFLTVQKSRERRRMMATKLPMKLSEYQPHSRYTAHKNEGSSLDGRYKLTVSADCLQRVRIPPALH